MQILKFRFQVYAEVKGSGRGRTTKHGAAGGASHQLFKKFKGKKWIPTPSHLWSYFSAFLFSFLFYELRFPWEFLNVLRNSRKFSSYATVGSFRFSNLAWRILPFFFLKKCGFYTFLFFLTKDTELRDVSSTEWSSSATAFMSAHTASLSGTSSSGSSAGFTRFARFFFSGSAGGSSSSPVQLFTTSFVNKKHVGCDFM